jgi:hypothetical protein
MMQPRATFNKDHEDIVRKFAALRQRAEELLQDMEHHGGRMICPPGYFEIRASALNLLARTAGEQSVYYRELLGNPNFDMRLMVGVITAAMTDYREGFMADAKLLVSAEVFADFLVQAEVLLEQDYKDAAAVIIGAVLEDGLRRVCLSKGIEPIRKEGRAVSPERAGADDWANGLTKAGVLTAIQKKEIDAKREIRNSAAHGKFNEYTKDDVVAFHEFVQRLLATLI